MSKISVKLKLFSWNSIFCSCQTRGFYGKWFSKSVYCQFRCSLTVHILHILPLLPFLWISESMSFNCIPNLVGYVWELCGLWLALLPSLIALTPVCNTSSESWSVFNVLLLSTSALPPWGVVGLFPNVSCCVWTTETLVWACARPKPSPIPSTVVTVVFPGLKGSARSQFP